MVLENKYLVVSNDEKIVKVFLIGKLIKSEYLEYT